MITNDELLNAEWQKLVEKDDRTSPEEYPDMVLISKPELAELLASRASETGVSEEQVAKALEVWSGIAWAFIRDHTNGGVNGAMADPEVAMRAALEAAFALSPAAQGKAEPGQTPVGYVSQSSLNIVSMDGEHDVWMTRAPVDVRFPIPLYLYLHPSPPSISAGRDEGLEAALLQAHEALRAVCGIGEKYNGLQWSEREEMVRKALGMEPFVQPLTPRGHGND